MATVYGYGYGIRDIGSKCDSRKSTGTGTGRGQFHFSKYGVRTGYGMNLIMLSTYGVRKKSPLTFWFCTGRNTEFFKIELRVRIRTRT